MMQLILSNLFAVLKYVFYGISPLVMYRAVDYFYILWRSYADGCRPVSKRKGIDPFFGIDVLREENKARLEHRILQLTRDTFEDFGTLTYSKPSFNGMIIITKDTRITRALYVNESGSWGVGPSRVPMHAFCGKAFLTVDGPGWEHSRALLKPSFKLSNISDLSRFDRHVQQLLSVLPSDGSTVDLQELVMRMFIDTSQDFIIGQSPGVFKVNDASGAPMSAPEFLKAFHMSLMGVGRSIYYGPFRFMLPKSQTTFWWDKVHRYIDHFVDKALQKKSKEHSSSQTRSMLENTALQTNDRLELRNQVLQGIMAAMDTTPSLVSNCVWLLARSPKIWTELRSSLLEIKPADVSGNLLREHPLLRNVLKETLRLHPVFPAGGRTATRDTVLPAGGGADGNSKIFVRKGQSVHAAVWTLHREPEIWEYDAAEFKPDRWQAARPSPWQYMPFGAGQRVCLGQTKALNEASYIIWSLAQKFARTEARDERDFINLQRLTMKNGCGCKVAFHVDQN